MRCISVVAGPWKKGGDAETLGSLHRLIPGEDKPKRGRLGRGGEGKSGQRRLLTYAAVDEAHVAERSQTNDGDKGPELDLVVAGRLRGVGSAGGLAERARETQRGRRG